jgi:CheY-like chemotaxis protein
MTPTWTAFAALLGAHPRLTASLAAGVLAAAWGLHLWRLRGRERHLVLLVDERTRFWQEEVSAHAALRALVGSGATSAAAHESERVARVLVVEERRDQREAMRAVFDGLGIAPVFADSPWAASEADADGAPYDLILVDASMEGLEADDNREAAGTRPEAV